MKTPEEIKKGLEYCNSTKPCADCPYDKCDFPNCVLRLLGDALAYIQQLESRLAQVEREREAAVACIQKMHEALEVKDDTIGSYRLNVSMALKAFTEWIMKWRGVYLENTKEDEENAD